MKTNSKGKVTLISVDEYGPSNGIRFISSVLKEAGYETALIFAPGETTKEIAEGKSRVFSDSIHDEIAKIVQGSLYVGISVVTPTFFKAREITKKLKACCDIPIVWGGVHAIVKEEECLEEADMICTCEGEEVAVKLADRLRENKPYNDIPGLKVKSDTTGEVISEKVPLLDITNLPKPDYALDGTHYTVTPNGIRPFYIKFSDNFMFQEYFAAPTRGCPYKCSYCVNYKYAAIFEGKRFRKRNLDNFLWELTWAKIKLSAELIMIDDDCFMALSEDEIRKFCEVYKKDVGLPFVIRGAHPQNITEEKLRLLCDAGLFKLRVGIQTGSDRIRELYERKWENNTKLIEMARLINKFIKKKQLNFVMYDLIVDNPWETEADRKDSLNLVLALPRPFGLYRTALTFYPGTALYQLALSEKRIKGDCTDEAYWRQFWNISQTPINETIDILMVIPLPNFIARYLAKKRFLADRLRNILIKFLNRLPEIGLFFKTRMRYKADLMMKVFKKNNTKESIKEYYRQSSLEKTRSRRFLIAIYYYFIVPGL